MPKEASKIKNIEGPDDEGMDRSSARYRLGEQVGFYLRQANQRHVAIFAGLMSEKLTTTQWAALAKLKDLQPCSQGNLGREIAMDMATVKGVVDRLVKRGFVHSETDPADGRRLVLTLTESGDDIIERNLPAALHVSEQTLSPLSAGERMILIELLRKIS